MATVRRQRLLSAGLPVVAVVFFLLPLALNQFVCSLLLSGVWFDFCRKALWWLYFSPALYFAYRFGYRGIGLTVLLSLLMGAYLILKVLQEPEAFSLWMHGLLALATSLFTALIVGRLTEYSNRAQESRDEQNARLKSLFHSSQLLSSSLHQDGILDKCLVLLRASFGFDYADVWLLQDERTLRLAASNIPASYNLLDTSPADSGLARLALTTGRAVFSEDPLKDERICDKTWVMKLGHRAEVAVPLIHKDKKLGVLWLSRMEKATFTPEVRELLQTFGNQLTLALQNAGLYQEMERRAILDELTGLYNHRYFKEALDRALKLAAREGTMLGLLMMDIDYFKNCNDIFGHPEGDRLLREFGGVLKGAVRETDIPVRYGGDEFAVILPHTDEIGTKQLATRVELLVAEHNFPGCGLMPGGKLSLSIGQAVYPLQASDKVELVKLADDNLYKIKEKRRNEQQRQTS